MLTSRSAGIFFDFTVGDGVPAVPICSIFLSSPFAGIGFCHPNPDNVHGVLQKYRHPFDKTILLNFLFFYWNLPPSPYPLPRGEGFHDGIPDVPINSIFLSSPFAGICFCHPNLDNVHRVLQKIRRPFDKSILLNFLFFYWNLPPSPYPLPQGEGFHDGILPRRGFQHFRKDFVFFTSISPKGRWFRFPQKLFYAA